MERKDLSCTSHHVNNHNHPSNGWFAQRLKAFITCQRLKALAFTMFKPIAFASFAAP